MWPFSDTFKHKGGSDGVLSDGRTYFVVQLTTLLDLLFAICTSGRQFIVNGTVCTFGTVRFYRNGYRMFESSFNYNFEIGDIVIGTICEGRVVGWNIPKISHRPCMHTKGYMLLYYKRVEIFGMHNVMMLYGTWLTELVMFRSMRCLCDYVGRQPCLHMKGGCPMTYELDQYGDTLISLIGYGLMYERIFLDKGFIHHIDCGNSSIFMRRRNMIKELNTMGDDLFKSFFFKYLLLRTHSDDVPIYVKDFIEEILIVNLKKRNVERELDDMCVDLIK
jgi:hypothetical protein